VPEDAVAERALVVGALAAVTAFLVAGLFEYNFGDTEVLLVTLSVMALPFVVERDLAGRPAVKASARRAAAGRRASGGDGRGRCAHRRRYLVHRPRRGAQALRRADGQGLVLLREAGVITAVITRRHSEIVERRSRELGIVEVHQDATDKGAVVQGILARHGVRAADACYVGDDVGDLPALALVGFPVAVADAVPAVTRAAVYVTRARGASARFASSAT